MSEWKSPRKIEEEVNNYMRERFDYHMERVDRGEITRKMAIKAITDEANFVLIDEPEEELF